MSKGYRALEEEEPERTLYLAVPVKCPTESTEACDL